MHDSAVATFQPRASSAWPSRAARSVVPEIALIGRPSRLRPHLPIRPPRCPARASSRALARPRSFARSRPPAVMVGVGGRESELAIGGDGRRIVGADLQICRLCAMLPRPRQQRRAGERGVAPATRIGRGDHVEDAGKLAVERDLRCADDAPRDADDGRSASPAPSCPAAPDGPRAPLPSNRGGRRRRRRRPAHRAPRARRRRWRRESPAGARARASGQASRRTPRSPVPPARRRARRGGRRASAETAPEDLAWHRRSRNGRSSGEAAATSRSRR